MKSRLTSWARTRQQPNVISALPISFVQPLLRGGGRAVTLEPLTQAERNLLYAVRTFALFRQQFFVVTLTGGTIQNFGAGFNLSGFLGSGQYRPGHRLSFRLSSTLSRSRSTEGIWFFGKVLLIFILS